MEGAEVAEEASSSGLVGDSDLLIVGPGVLGRLVAEKWRKVQFLEMNYHPFSSWLIIGSYALFCQSTCQVSLYLIGRVCCGGYVACFCYFVTAT